MARIKMLKHVTVKSTKGWRATYHGGKIYSENHTEFLPEGSYEYLDEPVQAKLFDLPEEPDLVDPEKGIG
jgi:hypothetical protein